MAALTLWLALAVASVVAFQVVVALDDAQPAGTTSAFDVVAVDTTTKAAAVDALEASATQLGVNIFKVQPAPDDSRRSRTLFAFVGDPDGFEAHGGLEYPSVTAVATTEVVPAREITTEDLRGRYVTSADGGQTARLLDLLRDQHLVVEDSTVSGVELLAYTAGRGNLVGSLAVVLVAMVLSTSSSVASHRKAFALRTLHGYRWYRSLAAELGGMSTAFGVGAAGLLVVGVPLLGAYNQYRQASAFLGVLAVTVAGLYLATLLMVVLAVWWWSPRRTAAAIAGERPSLRLAALAAGAQVCVLAVVMATTVVAMDRMQALREVQESSSPWTLSSDLYALRLSTAPSRADDLRDAVGLAAVVASQERAGQALLVGDKGSRDDVGAGDATAPEGAASLLVNNEYLRRQVVLDVGQHRVLDVPEEKDHFTLLVPSTRADQAADLLAQYVGYFRDFACTTGYVGVAACSPVGTVVLTEPGQSLFTYNGTDFAPAGMQGRMEVFDPVIAVVPAASGLLSPMEYLSYASLDDLLFSDPASLDQALQTQGVRGSFQGIDNAADAVATSVSISRGQLRMDAFSVALGWVVLVLACLVLAAVYCDRHTRALFVELVHGRSFTARHWRYLLGAAGLSLLGVGIAGLATGSSMHGRDAVAAGAFVAVQAGVSLAAVTVYESRFRADFVKRY